MLPFGLRHYWKGYFLRDLDRSAAEAIADGMRVRPDGSSFVLLEAINGRARVEPEGGAAFGQREARWNASAIAIWEDPTQDDVHIGWARRIGDRRSRRRRTRAPDMPTTPRPTSPPSACGRPSARSASRGCRPSSAATTPTTSSGSTSTCRQVRQLRDVFRARGGALS